MDSPFRVLGSGGPPYRILISVSGSLARSNAYLIKYYDLAKARVHRDDLPIFDVNVSGIPTVYLLVALHTVLAIFWIGLYAYLFQA